MARSWIGLKGRIRAMIRYSREEINQFILELHAEGETQAVKMVKQQLDDIERLCERLQNNQVANNAVWRIEVEELLREIRG